MGCRVDRPNAKKEGRKQLASCRCGFPVRKPATFLPLLHQTNNIKAVFTLINLHFSKQSNSLSVALCVGKEAIDVKNMSSSLLLTSLSKIRTMVSMSCGKSQRSAKNQTQEASGKADHQDWMPKSQDVVLDKALTSLVGACDRTSHSNGMLCKRGRRRLSLTLRL